MRKLLIALALFATPAHAQEVTINATRFTELAQLSGTVCQEARKRPGSVVDNLYSLVPLHTNAEKLLMLSLCRTYMYGYLHGVAGQ